MLAFQAIKVMKTTKPTMPLKQFDLILGKRPFHKRECYYILNQLSPLNIPTIGIADIIYRCAGIKSFAGSHK